MLPKFRLIVAVVELIDSGRYSQIWFSLRKFILRSCNHVEIVPQSPLVPILGKYFKQRTIQLNQGLTNDRHILTLTVLNVHHSHQRITSRQPLFRCLLKTPHATHQPRPSRLHNGTRCQTQTVAVVAVKGSGKGTSTLITKIVSQRRKFTFMLSTLLELLMYQLNNELLSLYLRHLNITVWIPIKQQLISNILRQEIK
jgi:hypothetical protein